LKLLHKGWGATASEEPSPAASSSAASSSSVVQLWGRFNASVPLLGLGTPLSLPIFLKFHKVGGTTVAACLRDREEAGDFGVRNYWCCDALWQEAQEHEDQPKGQPGRRPSKTATGKKGKFGALGRGGASLSAAAGCDSGGVGYEHNTLPIYKEHGFRGFQVRVCPLVQPFALFKPVRQRVTRARLYGRRLCCQVCTAFRPRVRALVVLRHPVTRWLSGLYYWGKVYTNPQARICLARKLYEDVRLDIAEAYRRLVQDPHQVLEIKNHIDRLYESMINGKSFLA
jgi:hypothetical protein